MINQGVRYPMEPVYQIPVRSLLNAVGNPMTEQVWSNDRFTAREVKRFIKEKRFELGQWCSLNSTGKMYELENDDDEDVNMTDWHIARIAYMTVNKQTQPIDIHVNCYGLALLNDGNHRFAAAIVRKDKYIQIIVDGFIDVFFKVFRSAKEI